MSKSPNVGLQLTAKDDMTTNAYDWAMDLTGEDESSNMMIIDTELAKRPRIVVSDTEPSSNTGDLWYQVIDGGTG